MGSRKSYSYATTIAETKHMPVGVEGDIQTLISPEAQVAAPGALVAKADPYGEVRQEISVTGLGADDVRSLLDPVFEDAEREREALAGLASSMQATSEREHEALTGLATSMQAASVEQTRQLTGVVEATRAPQVTQAKTEVKKQQDLWKALGLVVVVLFVLHLVL